MSETDSPFGHGADVLYEHDGHVALITLNRPERLNAITTDMIDLLSEALLRADRNRAVRAVILTGAGRGFCSGLDLQAVASGTMGIGEGGSTSGVVSISEHPPFVLRRIDTPVVCALNGPASGYGMDLALGCDLLLASETATFVSPVKRSLVPESGGTWLLPRLVGWHKACEIVLLARRLDAREIERLGLCNAVVAPEALMDEARRWADELAANPPLAVQAAKRGMRFAMDSTFEANAHFLMAELRQLMRTADFQEGVQSFVEKRPASYEGR
jgi:enoyl-CoA hydratase/carnithine racemase